MGRKRKCRLWWPSNIFSQTPPNSSFLFGWFVPSSEASLDVVVAFACDEPELTSSVDPRLDLQEILQRTNKNMPALQDKSKFCQLGYCEADLSGNGGLVKCGNGKNNCINLTSDQHLNTCTDHGSWSCGCPKHDSIFGQGRIAGLENMWIKLAYGLSETMDGRVLVIPKLDHLHFNSETMSHLDLHVFPSTCKKPKWFDDLHQRDAHLDLDTVIQAMNSANAAQILFSTFTWKLFAVSVASLSTVAYIILQSSRILFSWFSHTSVDIILAKVFSNTVMNIHFRCCQLLHWPISLQDRNIRKFFGIPLWFMAEPACLCISNFAHDFTNNWLRTGCVWLMGNPAGFKLNTELAGVLGMISLNAIQIWSTLWVFMGFLFVYFTKGLALCGIIFGLTSAAALVVDIISLVTMHVLTLHLFLSLLYSTQIQALAALWRLFRGRKGNPLRHRLDSYDYTVEQHVVGSPVYPNFTSTTNDIAFYIFFSPFCTQLRNRFPSGIWFEVTLCQHSETGTVSGSNSSPGNLQNTAYASSNSKSTLLVSFLHSNYLALGEVVRPHYKYFYSAFSRSSIVSTAYGLLTGRSVLYAPGPSFPVKLPWVVIPWKEYWLICHDFVYSCREDPYNSLR
ncbi:hypothetical protein DH2020_039030 [Rehmannia glutinosa]|uniref:Uncharacterized protein n=1 Tax=Rehmannia glutinosa TaxID=99300 RepID=A0ABR0UY43_REHGL